MCNAKENRLSSRDILAKIWRRTEIHSDFFLLFFTSLLCSHALIPPLFHPRMCIYKMRVTK